MTQEERVAKATKIIGQQLRLANALAFSIDILYNDIALRLRPLGGFKQERKRNYGIFTQKVKETLLWYEKCGLDEDFIEAAEGNWKRLDGFRAESNELVQILMLYLDRTGTYEAYDAVVKFLTELPEGGLFSAEDIARFNFRERNKI